MADEAPKSALELAMERLKKKDAETGASDIIWSSGPHALKRGSMARIT